MSASDESELLARRLPKAELHMHHMGALAPSEYARLHRVRERKRLLDEVSAAYDNRGLRKFFDDLDHAVAMWTDSASVTSGAVRMIANAFDRGVRHLELLSTPTLNTQQTGMPARDVLRALGEAFRVVEGELGITGGIIVEMHRYDGAAAARRLVEDTCALRDEGVPILGYGSDGDHRTVELEELAPAYAMARGNDFRLTGHVASERDVEVALGIGFDRIDHGWAVALNDQLMAGVAEAGIPVTYTPMAYLVSGRVARVGWVDAYRALTRAGVSAVIGTDDPELHHTDLAHSYSLMARRLDWSGAELARAALTSFESAWVEPAKRAEFVAGWQQRITALAENSRAPRRDAD
jgi:adenosine deaminase